MFVSCENVFATQRSELLLLIFLGYLDFDIKTILFLQLKIIELLLKLTQSQSIKRWLNSFI